MFDDLKPQSNNQNQTDVNSKNNQAGLASTPAQAQANTGEPEDIFAGTDKPTGPASNAGKDRPEQFKPKTTEAAPVSPNTPVSTAPAPVASTPVVDSSPLPQEKKISETVKEKFSFGQNKKYFIIGLIVVVVLVAILVGMIVLAIYKANNNKQDISNDSSTQPTASDQDIKINQPSDTKEPSSEGQTSLPTDNNENNLNNDIWLPEETNNSKINNEKSEPTEEDFSVLLEIMDSDNDGLTDAEEKRYTTNPYDKDTDGDGLLDREEVKIYKTDPKMADTDEDGYTDGSEVQNGYNPKGEGKLYELE